MQRTNVQDSLALTQKNKSRIYNMKIQISILIFTIIMNPNVMYSGILPDKRSTDWQGAGLIESFSNTTEYNILDFGASNDGFTANDNVLSELIKSIEKSGTIYFPEGTYLFNEAIVLKSNITLSGDGHDRTILIFELESEDDLINITGSIKPDRYSIVKEIKSGDSAIITDYTGIKSTQLIKLYDNDNEKITSDWAQNTSGQIVRVKETNEGQLIPEDKIRRNYELKNNPYYKVIEPIVNVSIEKLCIQNMTVSSGQSSNILLNYAMNCEIKCVESINCNYSHYDLRNCLNVSVNNCYVHDAFAYGGGGQGYGVTIHSTSGNCLVENNIFRHLRHSMLLQSGANGNVIAYNYSCEPYWTDVSLPEDAAGDLVLHGNYPYLNLFEGNIVQNIVIDDSHGINGPYNTFFRNRAEEYGIFMNFNPPTDEQNFIGNEVTKNELLKGLYFLNGINHFEFANNIKGEIVPEGSNELEEKSLYLNNIPPYLGDKPSIGPPNEPGCGSIPAKDRYKAGEYIDCEPVSGIESIVKKEKILKYISFSKLIAMFEQKEFRFACIYNIRGAACYYSQDKFKDMINLPKGCYIVFIDSETYLFYK